MKKRFLLIVSFFSILFAALLVACGKTEKYPVSVQGVQGGRISLSTSEAAAGETVIVTCTADDGFVYKDGSLKMNGDPVEENSFIMPEEPAIVTAEFISLDFDGMYLSVVKENDGYDYGVIEFKQETLTIGVTLAKRDFVFYENLSYERDGLTVTATVNGAEWTAEIGNGVVYSGGAEYLKTRDMAETFYKTFTEITEQYGMQNGYIERDFTISDGKLTIDTYLDNLEQMQREYPCKMFGNFVYIDESEDAGNQNPAIEKQVKYGLIEDFGGYYGFNYNFYMRKAAQSGAEELNSGDNDMFYPKGGEISLKQDGAYILKESFSPFNKEVWDIDCYVFIALTGESLAFSRHGTYYDGELHYLGENTAYERYGNVLKISYPFDERQFDYRFQVIDENTILVKSTMNRIDKYVFTENVSLDRAYGVPFTNEESLTSVSRYYEDGAYGDLYFDKKTGEPVKTEERGSYRIYGNLIVTDSGLEKGIEAVAEQDPEVSELGCDYKISSVRGIYWNDTCNGKSEVEIKFWKRLKGWEIIIPIKA